MQVKFIHDFMNSLTPDELVELSKDVKLEDVLQSEILKNAKGVELLTDPDPTKKVIVSIETHNQVSVSEIKEVK